MAAVRDQRFQVSSMGEVYRKTMEIFAHHLEDGDGNEIALDDVQVDQSFFVVFAGVTGLMRTSARRVA